MYYFNYGGAVTNNPFIAEKLMQAASNKAAQLGVSHVEFRDTIPRENYPVRADKVNMLLQLPESKELLWESFSSKLRAQIKRAMREDIVVKKGKIELIDYFYDVFAENMRDLGTPVYGKSFFKNILDSVPNSSDLLILYYKGKPVSAAFLLTHNEKMEIPWASTLRRVNHLSANMLLYWEVLSFALDEKCKTFDFGRSSKDAGTFKFKKQWGAKAQNSLWHYWLKDGGDLPALNPNNPKFKLMIAVWKKLPIFVTKIIGPMIVKNLP